MRPVAGGVDGADSAEVEHDPDLMGLLVESGEARGAGGGGFVAGAAGDDPAGGVAEAGLVGGSGLLAGVTGSDLATSGALSSGLAFDLAGGSLFSVGFVSTLAGAGSVFASVVAAGSGFLSAT